MYTSSLHERALVGGRSRTTDGRSVRPRYESASFLSRLVLHSNFVGRKEMWHFAAPFLFLKYDFFAMWLVNCSLLMLLITTLITSQLAF